MKKYILLFILITGSVFSQDLPESYLYQSNSSAKAGVFFQSIKIGNNNIDQIAFPVSLTIPLANDFTVSIVNSPAFSKNDNTEINGLAETKIGLRYYTLNEKLLLKVITGLPTGKTKYSIDQFNLAKLLSAGSLDYYVSFYGRGFNTNIGASYAESISKNLVIGAGLSYYYKGTFYPLDLSSGGEYDPGDEITFNLGMDYSINRRTKFNLDLIYSSYAMDRIDGADKFQPAPGFTIFSGFQFKIDNTTHNIYLTDRLKSDNKLFILGEEYSASNGNRLDIGYTGQFPLNMDLSLLAYLEGKVYGDIQQMIVGDLFETGKTNIFCFGAGARIFLSELLILDTTFKYKTGTINIIKGNIVQENNISGFCANANLYFRF